MAIDMNYSKAVMSKSYVIQWKSTVNGRSGRGTKLFDFEQAEELAQELNQEYPAILHEPVEASSGNQPTQPEPGEPIEQEKEESAAQAEAASEAPQIVHDHEPAMSFE
jgi:hypothetical protein